METASLAFTETERPQVWITWTETEQLDQHAARSLLPVLEDGPVTQWWFLRKRPHWRLRYAGGASAQAHLTDSLTDLHQRGVITSWHHSIYEPEHHAFGGPAAIALIHRIAHAETRYLLQTYCWPPELGPIERAALFFAMLLRAAGMDQFEQADTWAKIAELRHRPEPSTITPALVEQVHTLLQLDPEPVITRGLLGEPAPVFKEELNRVGHELDVLYRTGELTRGLRAVCAHHAIFSFNRWNLSPSDQYTLATAAHEALMAPTNRFAPTPALPLEEPPAPRAFYRKGPSKHSALFIAWEMTP